jgi:hypothetical protein
VDLADASAVAANTIRRAEVAEGPTTLTAANDLAIRRTLEQVGVEFIDENGGGPGVRLRKPPSRQGTSKTPECTEAKVPKLTAVAITL